MGLTGIRLGARRVVAVPQELQL